MRTRCLYCSSPRLPEAAVGRMPSIPSVGQEWLSFSSSIAATALFTVQQGCGVVMLKTLEVPSTNIDLFFVYISKRHPIRG
jgi:hypothetical protein